MSDTLAKKIEKKTIQLDGRLFVFSPVNWQILAEIETKFGCPVNEIKPILDKQPFLTSLELAWIFLKDDNKDLTRDVLQKINDHTKMAEINSAVGEILQEFFQGGK